MSNLQRELHKQKPFDSAEQEAYLNLLRTHSLLSADFERLFRTHRLSGATYNALRILRGASLQGVEGRSCHEIAEHLVAQVPDVTRLVDRLEKSGWAERRRCHKDRRVVYVAITRRGLELLKKLEKPVMELHRSQLGSLSRRDLKELSRLLSLARASAAT